MSDIDKTPLPDFDPEAEAAAEEVQLDLGELLNFMREFMLNLNERLMAVEAFLNRFIEEIQKQNDEGEDTKPNLTIVTD